MYYNNQTLRHKDTNKLVRLLPTAFVNNREAKLMDEHGHIFLDDINSYTHIEDEFGNPVSREPKYGENVCSELKKYLVSESELLKLRRKRLKEMKSALLKKMDNKYCVSVIDHSLYNYIFKVWFIKRMKAKPLYKYSYPNSYIDSAYVFKYNNKVWLLKGGQTCELHAIHLNKIKL